MGIYNEEYINLTLSFYDFYRVLRSER